MISEDHSADSLAKKPTKEQLDWSARVAAAQEALVKECDLDGLAYYYHGAPDGEYEKLQLGFIVGHSLLTAKGIPCTGEGDPISNGIAGQRRYGSCRRSGNV